MEYASRLEEGGVIHGVDIPPLTSTDEQGQWGGGGGRGGVMTKNVVELTPRH